MDVFTPPQLAAMTLEDLCRRLDVLKNRHAEDSQLLTDLANSIVDDANIRSYFTGFRNATEVNVRYVAKQIAELEQEIESRQKDCIDG